MDPSFCDDLLESFLNSKSEHEKTESKPKIDDSYELRRQVFHINPSVRGRASEVALRRLLSVVVVSGQVRLLVRGEREHAAAVVPQPLRAAELRVHGGHARLPGAAPRDAPRPPLLPHRQAGADRILFCYAKNGIMAEKSEN